MKKVLVIRFSSIGDIVLTTPVVRCLKKQHPDTEIHYLTKASFAGIMHHNPYVSKVHTLEDRLADTVRRLKLENFDFIIDLHHNIRSARVKSMLGVKSASFNKLNIEKWLLVNFKMNYLPSAHIVDRYMQAAKALGVMYDGEGLDYFIPEKDKVDVSVLPPEFRNGFVALVIGARHATKKMPEHKISALLSALQLPVVLLGGKEDEAAGETIMKSAVTHVYNACGKFNLNGSASLISHSRLVITHDTGLMHIAAALRKRIISLWGNTVPEFGMYPFLPSGKGDSVIIENKDLTCRPCSKIGFDRCPKGHFKCMNDLSNDRICSEAHRLWNQPDL